MQPGYAVLPLRTPTLPPATHTNAVVVGSGEVLLVDPGSPFDDERARLLTWLSELTRSGLKIRAAVLTHHHVDHVGSAAEVRRALSIPVWAHSATRDLLGPDVPIDCFIEDGEVIDLDGPAPKRVEFLHTPGHAPGHLCVWDPAARTIIAGDMVASGSTIIIDPTDGDMAQYLTSLERLRGLDAASLIPGHGDTIFDAHAKLTYYIEHRKEREAKILESLSSAPMSIDALIPITYGDVSPLAWPFAARSLESHLIKLEREGRARRDGAGWVRAA